MRKLLKTLTICSFVLFMAVFVFSTATFAAKAASQDDNLGPPNGMAIQEDAPGTKLHGVVYIEYTNLQIINPATEILADAVAVVRLRKGSEDPYVIVSEPMVVNLRDNSDIQSALEADIEPKIIEELFNNDTTLDVRLKLFDEFASRDLYTGPDITKVVALADLTVSVK